MQLQEWSTVWMQYEFDPASGAYSRRLVRRPGTNRPISGYASIEATIEHGRLLFCLYRWEQKLVFRAGNRLWAVLQPDLRFEFRRRNRVTAEFCVVSNEEESFRCSYRYRLRALFERIDVTYDGIDFMNDHFLSHIADLSPEAKKDRVEWIDGARSAG
jgi:hypothetical protein